MEVRHFVATPDYRLQRASLAFAAPASVCVFGKRTSQQRSKAQHAALATVGNASGGGGGSNLTRQNEEEGSALRDIAALLCSCEKLKAMVDLSLNSGVGPDVRNRVDHLCIRVAMLHESADRAARTAGGRVPTQLIASFKGLQREHSSLENIVRLATEAGPVLIELESNTQDERSVAVAAQKGTSPMKYGANSVNVERTQGGEDEVTVEVLSGPKYVMSTPPNEGSSKLAEIRAEIERRVTQQLVKKQFNQPIFRSGQGPTETRESMLTNVRKVPNVNGQSENGGKIDVEAAVLASKEGFLQNVEAKQLDELCGRDKTEFEARLQENTRTVSLEMHQQMVARFEKALVDVRDQLSQVTKDVKQKEAMLVDVKEKLMNEQSKLSGKIRELSTEITSRVTTEELNSALQTALDELDSNLNQTNDQVVSLSLELDKRKRALLIFQEEQERTEQELRADVMSLRDKLCHISESYEGFEPQSVMVDLGSIKTTLSALRKNQTVEHATMGDWQAKLGLLEQALCTNDNKIRELAHEVDSRVTERELNDAMKGVVDDMEIRSQQLHDRIKLIDSEQEENKTAFGQLQETWRTHRNELQTLTTRIDTDIQGVLAELSNKFTDLQENQHRDLDLIREAQQQIAAMEDKALELVKRTSEGAEAQRQILLDEIRTLVGELREVSRLQPSKGMQSVPLIQESDTKLDMRQLRHFIDDSSRQTSNSEPTAIITSHDQNMETLQKGAQELPDKKTASLEAFFSVMGQLIRQELKKMDATSAESLLLGEFHGPGVERDAAVSGNIHGSGSTYEDRGNQGQPCITLRYESSWSRAFVHFCADNHGWTEVPGMAMQEGRTSQGKYWKEFKINAARLEFVVTDGQGNWDRAPNGSNYFIEKPGIYELSGGIVKVIASN